MSIEIDGFGATDDNDLPIAITHCRDVIAFDGKIEQDYNFLIYRFAADDGEIEARTYLDDTQQVSITQPMDVTDLPPAVMTYLQNRFRVIKQLGGPDGYRIIWEKKRAGGA